MSCQWLEEVVLEPPEEEGKGKVSYFHIHGDGSRHNARWEIHAVPAIWPWSSYFSYPFGTLWCLKCGAIFCKGHFVAREVFLEGEGVR